MARINVDQSALLDPRFHALGKALGFPSWAAHATGLGLMIPIWNFLTERWSPDLGTAGYCLNDGDLTAVSRPVNGRMTARQFASIITNVGLAEETNVGYRIRGTTGRIEWLWRSREQARENGRAGGRPSNKPTSNKPPAPAPAPALKEETPDSLEPLRQAEPLQAGGDFVASFACTGTGPKTWTVSEADLNRYRNSYPAADVMAELRKMREWLLAHPTRRKTHRGMPAFVATWLSKAQDRPTQPGRSAAKPFDDVGERPEKFVNRLLTPEERAAALVVRQRLGIPMPKGETN